MIDHAWGFCAWDLNINGNEGGSAALMAVLISVNSKIVCEP